MGEVFSFDVTVSTHDLLRQGVCEHRLFAGEADWHRVVVWAENGNEAHLIAAQMASAGDWMCTGTYIRI